MFSGRLPPRLTPNRVSRAVAAARESGQPLFDLTETNPTVVGIDYAPDLFESLGDPRGAVYAPSALGLEGARHAVAARAGVSADRFLITASTSEAYSFLFKVLANPGDEVLVPRPSYPLFEILTRLDGVMEVPYRLDRDAAWALDRASIEAALTPRTRAVLIVSPNNPTGSYLHTSDREWLVALATAHGVALISDEVFADYPIAPRPDATSLAGESRALTFTLGGLSKSAGLPQVKLAWTQVSGPDALVADALDRLAIVADSYLSVSTAVQVALPRLLDAGRTTRTLIHARITRNLETLVERARQAPAVTIYPPEGGWSAVVRVPAILSDDEFVLRVLERTNVIVHPGYFFELEGEGFVVISLLPRPEIFDAGLAGLLAVAAEITP